MRNVDLLTRVGLYRVVFVYRTHGIRLLGGQSLQPWRPSHRMCPIADGVRLGSYGLSCQRGYIWHIFTALVCSKEYHIHVCVSLVNKNKLEWVTLHKDNSFYTSLWQKIHIILFYHGNSLLLQTTNWITCLWEYCSWYNVPFNLKNKSNYFIYDFWLILQGYIVNLSILFFVRHSQQARDVEQMLALCWSIIFNVAPTLNQHWLNVPCLLGFDTLTRIIWSIFYL